MTTAEPAFAMPDIPGALTAAAAFRSLNAALLTTIAASASLSRTDSPSAKIKESASPFPSIAL